MNIMRLTITIIMKCGVKYERLQLKKQKRVAYIKKNIQKSKISKIAGFWCSCKIEKA